LRKVTDLVRAGRQEAAMVWEDMKSGREQFGFLIGPQAVELRLPDSR